MIKIFKYLDPKLVTSITAETRDEVLRAMVDLLDNAGKLDHKQRFYEALIERERIVSTGIGLGVAIPHAKLADYDDFFIAIGVLQNGVDWQALDSMPVRIVCMIGGPDDKQTEYLQILSGFTYALKDEERRRKILLPSSREALVNLFREF